MSERPTKRRSRWSAALNGITAALLALSLGLIVGGVVWPEGEAPEAPEPYRELTASTPTRLFIPAIKVNAPIVPIQNDAHQVLQVPPNPRVMGWWDVSAEPGSETGQTLITGHALRDGSAPLNRLPDLKKGKPVDVITEEGRMRYRVTHVRVWDYDTVAEQAEELFGQHGDTKGRLLIVSCADFDGTKWNSNVIAFAKPLGEPQKAIEKQREREAEQEDDDNSSVSAAVLPLPLLS